MHRLLIHDEAAMTGSNGAGSGVDAVDVLGTVRRKGARLWSTDGELHYRAPRGALTDHDIARLKAARREIIALLEESTDQECVPPRLQSRGSGMRAPLSFAQLAHWRANRLDRDAHVRTVACATRLRGSLRVDLLRRSLAELVQRHEALRTRIVLVDAVPMQEVLDSTDLELRTEDLTSLAPLERDCRVLSRLEQLILEPIHVHVGPLVSVHLAKLSNEEHVLLLVMEHIVSDGFSLNLLLRDLLTAYGLMASNSPVLLPAVRIQPADYATWQMNARSYWERTHRPYWVERLHGCGRVRFPADACAATVGAGGWGIVPLAIDRQLRARLHEWSRLRRTTLVMSIFSAYAAVVLRWCGVSDAVLRFQSDGRFRPELVNTIGYLASMLHLRIELGANDTFLDLLERVSQEYCSAYEHHDLGYIEAHAPVPECTRNACFNWVSMLPPDGSGEYRDSHAGLRAEAIRHTSPLLKDSRKDAEPVVLLHDSEAGVVGGLHYPRDRQEAATMEQFVRGFFLTIEAMLRDPQTRVRDVLLPQGGAHAIAPVAADAFSAQAAGGTS
jgi:hypothetical protein